MKLTDSLCLANWLRANCTLSEIEGLHPIGMVGNVRFTEAARDKFRFIWSWSTVRFHGTAGTAQDRFYDSHGSAALNRRIERVRRVTNRFLNIGE